MNWKCLFLMKDRLKYPVQSFNKLFRKGNHGTLAYDIGTLNQRLIVMWTSGKLHNIHVYLERLCTLSPIYFRNPKLNHLYVVTRLDRMG